ncbi:MAG: DUF2398 family protein [Bacilli bacterium]|nr:DUF2398 family protein [Bacilli bacterium]
MEFKEELELLLNNYIITKEKNKDEYYKIKSKIKKIREFVNTKLGCDVIINSSLIKLEKLPSVIDNTFKIDEFNGEKDYILYLLVIMFLEDKAKEEQFILSNLTNFIINTLSSISNKKINIDFKDFSTRKSLVDVLKYSVKQGIIKIIDGNDELFKEHTDTEALYQNTGISHYIIRQFKDDIFSYTTPYDFLNTIDTEDALNKKRYYTYRSLLFYPILNYKEFDSEVYGYFINYRNRINADIASLLDGELLIYNDIALLTTEEKKNRYTFPNSRKVISDIVLLVNDYLIKEEKLVFSRFEFEQLMIKLHNEKKKFFSKEYREMKTNRFVEIVIKEMKNLKLVKVINDDYYFSSAIYLISGNYKNEENDSVYSQLNLDMEV